MDKFSDVVHSIISLGCRQLENSTASDQTAGYNFKQIRRPAVRSIHQHANTILLPPRASVEVSAIISHTHISSSRFSEALVVIVVVVAQRTLQSVRKVTFISM